MTLRPIPRPKVARVGRAKGKFTQSRRLDVLRSLLEGHPSGLTLEQMAESLHVSTRSVRRYLHELGLMTDVNSKQQLGVWFNHGISHGIGLNVHDPGRREFQPGMAITMEPVEFGMRI